MTSEDAITDKQLRFIEQLAAGAVTEYKSYPDLDRLVIPVYGVPVHRMNRGQASMLIDDLLYRLGSIDEMPEHPSIFGEHSPRPRSGAGRK
jgi:hypothetical protein